MILKLRTAPLLAVLCATTAMAQQPAEETPAPSREPSVSGYSAGRAIGGPEGVSQELERNQQLRDAAFELEGVERFFDGYFDWKQQVNEDFRVKFGFQYYLLPQLATTSQGDKDAAGDIFRFNGSWTLFEKANDNFGRIEWRAESRSNVFGLQSPSQLGGAVGAAALNTGFAYNPNFDLDLAVLNWTQGFRDATTGIAAGRLAFDVYLDAMPFQTFSRGFMNRAFLLNPTIGTTGIGSLGAVGKGFVTDNIWVGGHLYDGNAVSGEFDFDTVREGEWLSAIEFGWTPGIDQRKKRMVQFTWWHKDAREQAGVSSGNGWAVSAVWELSEQYFPFVRMGYSNGGAGVVAEAALSGGVEMNFRPGEVWTVGAGWARPSERTYGSGLRNEWVLETSYKFQLARNFSLTPDLQVLFNPANNPNKRSVWVAGLRFIFLL